MCVRNFKEESVKFIATTTLAIMLLLTSGCGNLSPRDNFSPQQRQEIDNQNGRIGEVENISNGLKAELLKLQQNDEILNSELDRVQKGMVNLQSNNSGVQILSGSGGLMVAVIAIIGAVMLVSSYRRKASQCEKTSEILAEKIVEKDDFELEEEVFKAAMYTDVEAEVYHAIEKAKMMKDQF